MNKLKKIVKGLLGMKLPGKDFKLRKDDILLISYPKSGNTWLRFLFGNILYSDGVDFTNINARIPDIYMSYKQDIEKLKSPRVIKSHEQFNSLSVLPKIIYIYRDPRDVVVSYFYWSKKFNNKYNDFNQFFDDFISGKLKYGSWIDHVEGWGNLANKFPQNVMIVRYDELKNDTYSVFSDILDFVGMNFSPEIIREAISKSEFKEMQKLENKQEKGSFFKDTNLDIKFVRSGKSEWKEILSKEQLDLINEKFKIEKYYFQ